LIKSLASRSEVKKAYSHKFRHTFASTYLRSGGDVFTLQSLLGHGSLDMVRHYARIAQVGVEQAHRKASPVDNWRGMAKANLKDWDGAAQDLRRAHLLNPNFLPPGKELQRIHSLGLASSLSDSPNPVLTDLASSQGSSFTSFASIAAMNPCPCGYYGDSQKPCTCAHAW